MSITLTLSPKAPAAVATVRSIARSEAERALRHPMTWIGSIGSLILMWMWVGGVAPILPRESIYLAGGLLPLMAAGLLVARDATLREKDAIEIVDTLPTARNRRTLGIQLGMLALVVLAFGLQLMGLIYLYLGGPVGEVNWWEVTAGPTAVAAAAMLGVLLGRVAPHPVIAPLLLLVAAFFQLLASPDAEADWSTWPPKWSVEWLAPWLPPSGFSGALELAFRPFVERFWYLVSLALVLGVWAHRFSLIGRLATVVVSGAFGWAIFWGMENIPHADEYSRQFDWAAAAADQVCVVEDGVEYCAFEIYEAWITDWQETVAAVADHAPLELDYVIQRPSNTTWGNNSDLPADGVFVVASMNWDRRGSTPVQRREFAHHVGLAAVGLPASRFVMLAEDSAQRGFPGCYADGQARAVVAVWLSLASVPGAAEILDEGLARHPAATPVPMDATMMARSDIELGRSLYDLDINRVTAEMNQKWDLVLDPSTTSAELASWFDLPAPSYTEPNYGFGAGPCP